MNVILRLARLFSGSTEGSRISREQAKQKIGEGALLLDVRSAQEFHSGHLEEALNIPHTDIQARVKELGTDKSREIVIYCKSGGRAGSALQALKALGFSKVYNAGGYDSLR